jgi:DNA-binding transcriptional LysR family regulator
VQIETNLILLLPALIEQNRLLSFVSRRHLQHGSALKEVPLKDTTMRRRFVVAYRKGSYLSPAAARCVNMLRARGKDLFEES